MYDLKLGMMLLAIADLDVDAFKTSYDDIKTLEADQFTANKNGVEAAQTTFAQNIFGELKRSLEDMKDVSMSDKQAFINACIDYIDIPVKEKEFFKVFAVFNLPGNDIKEKGKFISQMKKTAPARYKKEVLMYELGMANSSRDLEKIRALIKEINETK